MVFIRYLPASFEAILKQQSVPKWLKDKGWLPNPFSLTHQIKCFIM